VDHNILFCTLRVKLRKQGKPSAGWSGQDGVIRSNRLSAGPIRHCCNFVFCAFLFAYNFIKYSGHKAGFGNGENVPNAEMSSGGRLDAPFFCHCVNERTFRVASNDEVKRTHPCGVTGVASVAILVSSMRLDDYLTLCLKSVGTSPQENKAVVSEKSFILDIIVPRGL
jgi:hypothetical protein